MKNKLEKLISIILVISIICISVYAVDGEGFEGEGELTPAQDRIPANGTSPEVQYIPPTIPSSGTNAIPFPTPSNLSEIWANMKAGFEALLNLQYIGSYLLNIKTYLQVNDSNGNTIGNDVDNLENNFYYAYNGPIKGLYNMFSSSNGQYGGLYYRILTYLYNPSNGSGFFPDLASSLGSMEGKIQNILLQETSIQSDLHSIFTMFASGIEGGSYYYRTFNELYNPNNNSGVISNISVSSSNTAAGIANTNSTLTNLFTWTDGLNHSGLSVFKDHNGRNFLNGIDSSTSDLLNYFYAYFIDDDRPNSMNGGELIDGIYSNSSDILDTLGHYSNSVDPSDRTTILDQEIEQNVNLEAIIDKLDDIEDVISNSNDQTIIVNQTDNTTTVHQTFLSGTSSDTSLGKADFLGLAGVLGKLRSVFRPSNIGLGDFNTSFDQAQSAGSFFFSQEVYNDLNGITGS